jgi:membrane-associated phospholipid phosphatase
MTHIQTDRPKKTAFISEIASSLLALLKSRYFYIALITAAAGTALNIASQTYLHNYLIEGKTLPMLSDLVLDNLPVLNVAIFYDLFCIVIFTVVGIYLVHKKVIGRLPYILLLCGIFYMVRGVFIVLTPFGNPPEFNGSYPLFNGFSKFDIGVYPSGHVGNSFLLLLLVNNKVYRYILSFCLAIIIISLFLSHGHYSIDILSGFFFAYAIKSFGDKYLIAFDLSKVNRSPGIMTGS